MASTSSTRRAGCRSLGGEALPTGALSLQNIHGVSIDYVKKMKARFKNVSVDELVEMRIHGRS